MNHRIILIVICFVLLFTNGITAEIVFNVSIEKTPDLVIDGESSEHAYFINSVAVDEDGFIYLADNYSFSILKFSYDGQFINRTGSKGQGPGDFIAEPWRIALADDHVLVTSKNMREINVFDKDLKYKTTWDFSDYKVFEISAYEDLLIVHSPYIQDELPVIIAEMDDYLQLKYRNKPNISPKLNWKYMKAVVVNRQGKLIVASRLEDLIEKWSVEFNLIWRKNAFEGQKIKYINHRGEMKPDPRSVVFRSVAVDSQGNVYLLGGNPREIGVMSDDGRPITVLSIPFAANNILIDKYDRIYLLDFEGSVLRYQLNIIKTTETAGESTG